MKKQFVTTILIALALALMPYAFARISEPLTPSTLGATYWPVNSGRTGYCLVARLVYYNWNGELRPITGAQIHFYLDGMYLITAAPTDVRGFAYVHVWIPHNMVFTAIFDGDSKYTASISGQCLVRMVHQHWWV